MVLCFGSLVKAVLIANWYFDYCWTVLMQQGFHYLSLLLPASRLVLDRRLGGSVTKASDLSRPKGYSIPCNIMLNIKLRGSLFESSCSFETGWSSLFLWEVISECFYITFFFIFFSSFSFTYYTVFILTHETFTVFTFQILSSVFLGWVGSK